MTPTLKDMAMLTDFLIDRTSVTNHEGSIDKDTLCDHLLGRVPLTNTYRGNCIKLTWLDANFQTPPTSATIDQLFKYVRGYILHMFGGLVFTSTTDNAIPLCFLTLLDDFWAILNYS
jgi:hypothetical protein